VDQGTDLEEGYSEHYLGASSHVKSLDFKSSRQVAIDVWKQRNEERESRRRKMEAIFSQKEANLEPFTMKGQMTAEGLLIEDRKEEVIQDAWFDEWKEKSEDKDYKQPVVSDEKLEDELPTDPIKLRYILKKHMLPGETILAALRRLGSNHPTGSSKKKNVRRNQGNENADNDDDDNYDWRAAVQRKSNKKKTSTRRRGYDYETNENKPTSDKAVEENQDMVSTENNVKMEDVQENPTDSITDSSSLSSSSPSSSPSSSLSSSLSSSPSSSSPSLPSASSSSVPISNQEQPQQQVEEKTPQDKEENLKKEEEETTKIQNKDEEEIKKTKKHAMRNKKNKH